MTRVGSVVYRVCCCEAAWHSRVIRLFFQRCKIHHFSEVIYPAYDDDWKAKMTEMVVRVRMAFDANNNNTISPKASARLQQWIAMPRPGLAPASTSLYSGSGTAITNQSRDDDADGDAATATSAHSTTRKDASHLAPQQNSGGAGRRRGRGKGRRRGRGKGRRRGRGKGGDHKPTDTVAGESSTNVVTLADPEGELIKADIDRRFHPFRPFGYFYEGSSHSDSTMWREAREADDAASELEKLEAMRLASGWGPPSLPIVAR